MIMGFTPLQTYKVLKPVGYTPDGNIVLHHYKLTRFSNNTNFEAGDFTVLHHYKLTRFSNTPNAHLVIHLVLHHYKLTRFSNSS